MGILELVVILFTLLFVGGVAAYMKWGWVFPLCQKPTYRTALNLDMTYRIQKLTSRSPTHDEDIGIIFVENLHGIYETKEEAVRAYSVL